MDYAIYTVSAFFILSGIIIALYILLNIRTGNRQPMKIMEAVWPLTGLWANWIGLWAYFKMGKTFSPNQNHSIHKMAKDMDMDMGMNMRMGMDISMQMPQRPRWQSITLSTLHCGAGCTLADIIGESFTFWVPLTIGGSFLAGQWILDYALALIIGIYFQYAAIRPMENLPRGKVIAKAFKIDFLSLTSWQLGMYGWMAIFIFGIRQGIPLARNTWEFWFMMQIAMFVGFLTSYPTNWFLVKSGIKHGM